MLLFQFFELIHSLGEPTGTERLLLPEYELGGSILERSDEPCAHKLLRVEEWDRCVINIINKVKDHRPLERNIPK